MKRINLTIGGIWLVLMATAVTSGRVYGYGEEGHQIVGEIAFHELNAKAKTEVLRLLRTDPDSRYNNYRKGDGSGWVR